MGTVKKKRVIHCVNCPLSECYQNFFQLSITACTQSSIRAYSHSSVRAYSQSSVSAYSRSSIRVCSRSSVRVCSHSSIRVCSQSTVRFSSRYKRHSRSRLCTCHTAIFHDAVPGSASQPWDCPHAAAGTSPARQPAGHRNAPSSSSPAG